MKQDIADGKRHPMDAKADLAVHIITTITVSLQPKLHAKNSIASFVRRKFRKTSKQEKFPLPLARCA